MDKSVYFIVIGVVMIFHLPLAFFASREILDYPMWSRSTKSMWLVLAWLLPYIGYKAVNRKLNLRIRGGGTGGEDTYTGGGE